MSFCGLCTIGQWSVYVGKLFKYVEAFFCLQSIVNSTAHLHNLLKSEYFTPRKPMGYHKNEKWN